MKKYSFSEHWAFFLNYMHRFFFGKQEGGKLTKIEKRLRLFFYLSMFLLMIMFLLWVQKIVDPLIVYIFTFLSGVMLIILGIYGFIYNKGINLLPGGLDFVSGFPVIIGQLIYLLIGIGLIWLAVF